MYSIIHFLNKATMCVFVISANAVLKSIGDPRNRYPGLSSNNLNIILRRKESLERKIQDYEFLYKTFCAISNKFVLKRKDPSTNPKYTLFLKGRLRLLDKQLYQAYCEIGNDPFLKRK